MSKRVGVMIQHPAVWEEFKTFVQNRWGKKHTAMAIELENAIKTYMQLKIALEKEASGKRNHKENIEHQEKGPQEKKRHKKQKHEARKEGPCGEGYAHTQIGYAHTQNNKKQNITMDRLYKIAEEICRGFTKEIPQMEIEKIITMVVGGDDRTVRKYLRLLQMHGFLIPDKEIKPMPGKFIFRVQTNPRVR